MAARQGNSQFSTTVSRYLLAAFSRPKSAKQVIADVKNLPQRLKSHFFRGQMQQNIYLFVYFYSVIKAQYDGGANVGWMSY
jgi:hypothetical protein